MEEGRNIPLIIMLAAGSVISIACIIYKFSLMNTLLLVFGTLILFFFLGLIIKKLFNSINRDAERRASLIAQEEYEAKQRELAEQEELAESRIQTAETDDSISFE